MALNHDEKGNNDLLNLTKPEVVRTIAGRFVAAGADILATNTFNANRISMADYGAEHLVRDINIAAARIIREVADADGKRRWVAGAMGPTNKTLSLSPDVNDPGYREVDFDGVKAVYREQVDALVEGGVDFILIETVFDTLNCKAAIMATLEAEADLGRPLPIMAMLVAVVGFTLAALVYRVHTFTEDAVHVERNYYGVLRVKENQSRLDEEDTKYRSLVHELANIESEFGTP